MSTSVSSSTDPPSAPAPPRRNASRRRFRIWVALASTLLVIGGLALLIGTQGSVSGEEFSPTHFQSRRFSFYEIPVIHWQITPIHRSGTTSATARYVRQKGLIPTVSGPPTIWHPIVLSRGFTGATPADAQLLIDQLNLQRKGKAYWRTWSQDHPQRAKVLWNTIAKLARRELYILMPTLFEQAQQASTADELQRSLDRSLKAQYAGLIRDMRQAGRPEVADSLWKEAIADYPEDATLQKLRP